MSWDAALRSRVTAQMWREVVNCSILQLRNWERPLADSSETNRRHCQSLRGWGSQPWSWRHVAKTSETRLQISAVAAAAAAEPSTAPHLHNRCGAVDGSVSSAKSPELHSQRVITYFIATWPLPISETVSPTAVTIYRNI